VTEIEHTETKQIVLVDIVAYNGIWLMASDGYQYDMRHWRRID
jgi:hypothetical protein